MLRVMQATGMARLRMKVIPQQPMKEKRMKSLTYRLVAALVLLGAIAGCAATGDQQTALQWLQQQDEAVRNGE